jgi:hypothetical protein
VNGHLSGAAAGRKLVNAFPLALLKAFRGRNIYPQNVNEITGYSRRRPLSAQYQVHRHFPPACLCPSNERLWRRAAAGYATARLKRRQYRLEQIDGFLAQTGPSLDAEPL